MITTFFPDLTRDPKFFSSIYSRNMKKTDNRKVGDRMRKSESECSSDLWHHVGKSTQFFFPENKTDIPTSIHI